MFRVFLILLLQHCRIGEPGPSSKIEVDRDANVVRCYVRKVPAVSPEIEEMYQRSENAQRLQKRRCAKSLVAGIRSDILL